MTGVESRYFLRTNGHPLYFAWRRVYGIRALLGDVIDRVIDNQVKKFHDEEHDEDGAQWDPETWKKFLPLIGP